MADYQTYHTVRDIIQRRKTTKVFAVNDGNVLPELDVNRSNRFDRMMLECIAAAGMAPFHYARKANGVPEPWRFYQLKQSRCRQLADELPAIVTFPVGRVPELLKGCDCLVLVTWIPQNLEKGGDLDPNKLAQVNEEHLAATSAAVQNLLLLCESLGWSSYWASGGVLNNSAVFDRLEICRSEKLCAAVFVQYELATDTNFERLPGKQRSSRTQMNCWTKIIE